MVKKKDNLYTVVKTANRKNKAVCVCKILNIEDKGGNIKQTLLDIVNKLSLVDKIGIKHGVFYLNWWSIQSGGNVPEMVVFPNMKICGG